MEGKTQEQKKQIPVVLIVVIALLLGVVGVLSWKLLSGGNDKPGNGNAPVAGGNNAPQLGYATEGITVVDDSDALQEAVDAMFGKAEDGYIALEYRDSAKSSDGTVFDCYLMNSLTNTHDVYFQIFTDEDMEDEVCLTGLVRPGEGFDKLTFSKRLPKGTTMVYVVETLVDDDHSTLLGQAAFTMQFTVE